MKVLQKILLEQSENRQAISTLLETPTEKRSESFGDDLNKLSERAKEVESELQAALLSQGESEQRSGDGEGREIDRLVKRSSIEDYVLEVTDDHAVEGASKELREAVLGGDMHGYMPLEMLEETPLEQRADAVSDIGTAIQDVQMPIAARAFPRSSVQYLGIATPTVPVGTVSYPRLNAGTTADVRSDGVELDGTAATLTTKSFDPIRLTGSYTYAIETLSRVRGWSEALTRDIRSVLQDKRDKLALNGQSAVADTSPAITGIIGSFSTPTAPSGLATWSDYLGGFDALVDGIHAQSAEEVRLLTNPETWRQAVGLAIATSGELLRDRLPATRFRASANMPAKATHVADAIAYATGAQSRGYLMPVWAGLQLIDDRITLAKKGQRILTAIMMVSFDMIDTSGYKRLSFQISS